METNLLSLTFRVHLCYMKNEEPVHVKALMSRLSGRGLATKALWIEAEGVLEFGVIANSLEADWETLAATRASCLASLLLKEIIPTPYNRRKVIEVVFSDQQLRLQRASVVSDPAKPNILRWSVLCPEWFVKGLYEMCFIDTVEPPNADEVFIRHRK